MLRKVNLEAKLREMMGSMAELRGQQKQGLQAIMRREPRVLMVMKTGGGKSLMYMMPAHCSVEGVTVVVVPLRSLQEYQGRRCKQAGLNVAQWSDTKKVRTAQAVLITPESAVTKAFGRFMNEKVSMGLLESVVIDECHIILDSIYGWRFKVLELMELCEGECQLIYLTSTLPHKDMPAFWRGSGLDPTDVLMLRDNTSRANVAYRVIEYPTEDEDEAVQKLVEEKLRQYSGIGQIVVYCRSIKQCITLGGVLKCPMYFREVGSEDEKRGILQNLAKGQERVFVATHALGLGIDAAGIRGVLLVGVKAKMKDYGQERRAQ
ncbi:hypothetical protein LTR74_017781 [Friedmanniomyces endolithicus]|nr:hypothetical protein LTR74_017781 [Friedmanniomyces endolithicus]